MSRFGAALGLGFSFSLATESLDSFPALSSLEVEAASDVFVSLFAAGAASSLAVLDFAGCSEFDDLASASVGGFVNSSGSSSLAGVTGGTFGASAIGVRSSSKGSCSPSSFASAARLRTAKISRNNCRYYGVFLKRLSMGLASS